MADLDVPDGLAMVRDFTKLHPEARILALSEREDTACMQTAFASGAHGYMSKQDSTAEVVAGLMALTQGRIRERADEGLTVRQVVDGRLKSEPHKVERLSPRELEVFRLVGRGVGTEAQAAALKLSVKTVETHRARIKQKLGARDGVELRRRAEAWLAKNGRGRAGDAGKKRACRRGD